MKTIYYAAYGVLMKKPVMANIIPEAEIFGAGTIKNYRLMFIGDCPRSYATIEEDDSSEVPVVVWQIPDGADYFIGRELNGWGDYHKAEVVVEVGGEKITATIHLKNEAEQLNPPDSHYYAAIYEAYEQNGFDLKILEDALAYSNRQNSWG